MREAFSLPVDIKLLNEFAKVPTKGSRYSAGYDLYAAIDKRETIFPHTTKKIDTGIAVSLPPHTFGGIYPRSGLATKEGLRCANCVGIN